MVRYGLKSYNYTFENNYLNHKMAEEKKDISGSDDESEEEDPAMRLTQEDKDKMLLTAVKDNQFDAASEAIDLGADVNCEEAGGWNPILWAACNGNLEIVRLLIKH